MRHALKQSRRGGWSFWLSGSSLVGVFAMALAAPGAALAQQAASEEQEIVVTGSRLPRDPNTVAASPVQFVGAEQILEAGNLNVVDTLNDLPALGFSTTSETTLQSAQNDGQNTLDLRGLGEDRTLTLVNGRRHVAGVEGSQSVEISSIPPALIQRVEVLTGGASALYGADAVTGVVNFILREDFEGLDLRVRGGVSSEGDAEQLGASALWGINFDQDRGNFTLAAGYEREYGLTMGDRPWAANNGVADDDQNPALRFQQGEIGPTDTPNFAAFYDFATTGRFPYGLRIPTAAAFAQAYEDEFGVAPVLTAAEQALIERAASAPTRAILPFHTFSISSKHGVISPGDFSVFSPVDTNGNGRPDCQDSFVGWNNSLDANGSFGLAGGCWVVENNVVRPYQDGLVAGNFNGFGGDGIENFFDEDSLIPESERYYFNTTGRIQVAPYLTVFGEAKYVYSETHSRGLINTFYDLLFGAPENPFLPPELQDVADATGGLFITRDMIDLGPNIDTNERSTMRIVLGAEGEIGNGWDYELAANFGEFEFTGIDRDFVILDRWFAAIDVIDGDPGAGVAPICRSDVDPTPPPTTIFGIPPWESGFFSFTPGDGQCEPADIWSGVGGLSQAAIDFITTTAVNKEEITQTVLSAQLTGDSADWFKLPGGPIGVALGAEWRRETSRNRFSPWVLGLIPGGSPFPEGTLISDVSENASLGFLDAQIVDSYGEYDVTEGFIELSAPIFRDAPFADELTLQAAYRYSDYSSSGGAETWTAGLTWAPISDIKFRATQSQAVRAPNIFELFSPLQGAVFRPVDPCDAAEIAALAASDPARAAIRAANCEADFVALGGAATDFPDYTDPLSARFPGVIGGNDQLTPETADTTTLGVVFQPRFLEGFTLTVDYWNIEVADAIVAVAAQDIVDNCYDSTTFPNQFCSLFTRNDNPGSSQFFGFTFLQQTQLNFGKIESRGIDVAANYNFALGSHEFSLRAIATRQEKLDFFFDPADPTAVDPELGEIFRPEWSGNFYASWDLGPFELNYHMQYIGEQLLRAAEVETYLVQYGTAAETDAVYLHNLGARFELSDEIHFFGGVQNVADEQPFITEFSYPAGPRGRFFFLGVNAKY